MKNLYLALCLLFYGVVANSQFSIYDLMERRDLRLSETEAIAKTYFDSAGTEKGSGYKQFQRWLYENRFHQNDDGYLKSPLEEEQAFQSGLQQLNTPNTFISNWTSLGPDYWNRTTSWNPGNGQIKAIGISAQDSTIIYAGSQGGGLWKSTNSGTSWIPLSDNSSARMTVNAVTIDPNNINIVYLGATGNFKSTDAGASWITMSGIAGTVKKFLVQPSNSNIIFAASTSGIYRSVNAGTNWTQVNNTNAEDIEFKPGDPNIMYASGSSAIVRSVNNGVNWTVLTSANGITNSGRTLIAVSAADPDVVYAVQANGSLFGRLYRSNDAGLNFTTQVVGNPASGTNYFGYETNGTGTTGQAGYDMAIAASPFNANDVNIAGIIVFRSTNGGLSFTATTGWSLPNGTGYNHADVHVLLYCKNTLYSASDGGIYKRVNNTGPWTDLSVGLGIRMFYRIGSSQTNAAVLAGGAQDNGSSILKATGWIDWLGADGMETVISNTNANIVFGTSQNGQVYRSVNCGGSYNSLSQPSTGQWVTPMAIHPVNDSILFVGWAGVYKSTDRGTSFTKISGTAITSTLAVLTVAPSDPNYIYAANGSTIYLSRNGGTTWTSTPAPSSVASIAISHTNPEKIWVACNNAILKVFVSTDGGSTFTNISGALPNISPRTIVVDKSTDEGLYVGMNTGVYYYDNISNAWSPFLTGLPLVSINELEIQHAAKKIRAATYGRGIWETALVDQNVLPVTWIQFDGKKKNDGNELRWLVEENPLTDKYEIEKSLNGIQYYHLTYVNATGAGRQQYNFLDRQDIDKNIFYRIRQWDKNGHHYYSPFVLLKGNTKEDLVVTPNPVINNTLQLKLNNGIADPKGILQIYNVNGIQLLQQNFTGAAPTIDIKNFAAGQYFIRLITDNKIYRANFTKLN